MKRKKFWRRDDVYKDGVSLLAVLRRVEGHVAIRRKPADILADLHDPRARAG